MKYTHKTHYFAIGTKKKPNRNRLEKEKKQTIHIVSEREREKNKKVYRKIVINCESNVFWTFKIFVVHVNI